MNQLIECEPLTLVDKQTGTYYHHEKIVDTLIFLLQFVEDHPDATTPEIFTAQAFKNYLQGIKRG